MDLAAAKRKLFDKTFLVATFRQNAALEFLDKCSDIAAVDVLAEALSKGHPKSERIRQILARLQTPADQAKIDRLWQLWSQGRPEPLARVLTRLGCPAQDPKLAVISNWKLARPVRLQPDPRQVRGALKWLRDKDPDIRQGLLKTVQQLPHDGTLNDELFESWLQTESAELEALLQSQNRVPQRTDLEALFCLVTGLARKYEALGDENGELFLRAFLMAPASFRQRINQTVLNSGSARLVEVYSRAMAGQGEFDPRLYVDALKSAGDDDRLFEAARDMKLTEALDLCQHWSEHDRWPQDDRWRNAAQRAVGAYRELGELKFESGPAPPEGTRDLFETWKQTTVQGQPAPSDFQHPDPLVRARALYVGQPSERQWREAAQNDDWLIRLVARLRNPVLAATTDHVPWIGALSGIDADLLDARLSGTPAEYKQFSQRLAQARSAGAAARHSARILEILCAFQGAFVSGGIELVDSDAATDRGAVTVVDAIDAPLDGF
ncbi:MAG: hypothetical protein J5I93_13950 [Pirellulaceae bacterium]|nr:hypothetical protein [Pirellulaceae bacterium]